MRSVSEIRAPVWEMALAVTALIVGPPGADVAIGVAEGVGVRCRP